MNLKHFSIEGISCVLESHHLYIHLLTIVEKVLIQLYYKLWLTQDISFGTMNLHALIITMIRHWLLFDKYVYILDLHTIKYLNGCFKHFGVLKGWWRIILKKIDMPLWNLVNLWLELAITFITYALSMEIDMG
jgi:hypothetical protein